MFEPANHLKGERVFLRSPLPADLEQIFAMSRRNQERLRPFLAWASKPVTLDSAQSLISSLPKLREERRAFHYLILFDGNAVGAISAHSIDQPKRSCELGFWIEKDFEGKGIVSEAVTVFERELFRVEFERIVLSASEHNFRSAAVARRLGFTFVARREKARCDQERWVDLLVFEKRK